MPPSSSRRTVAASVRRWYDQHGWRRDEATGLYRDTATFSGAGSRSAGAAYYEARSYERLNDRFPGGRYFLDAACGALAHREYLPWSAKYDVRICVDISSLALSEARLKLGSHGCYVQANIVELPLADSAIDGGLSAYTVQHVNADDQLPVLREFVRVLSPGSTFVIISGIEPAIRSVLYRAFRGLLRRFTYKNKSQVTDLYYFPRSPEWWRARFAEIGIAAEVQTMRLLRPNEYRLLFGSAIWPAKMLHAIERRFPKATLPLAASAVITLRK
jgi:SAM-dependent methyltransferase